MTTNSVASGRVFSKFLPRRSERIGPLRAPTPGRATACNTPIPPCFVQHTTLNRAYQGTPALFRFRGSAGLSEIPPVHNLAPTVFPSWRCRGSRCSFAGSDVTPTPAERPYRIAHSTPLFLSSFRVRSIVEFWRNPGSEQFDELRQSLCAAPTRENL